MAAITFPASPANNDIHNVGTRSWKFNGTAWKLVPKTTDTILEGSNNLYYTEDRVASAPAVSALEGRASAIEADITGMGDTLSSEISRATAAEAALGTRIDNVLSNVDDAALDSLTEIVSAFQAADADLNGAITNLANAAGSDLTALEGRVDTLESEMDAAEGRLDTVEAEKAPIDSPTFTNEILLDTGDGYDNEIIRINGDGIELRGLMINPTGFHHGENYLHLANDGDPNFAGTYLFSHGTYRFDEDAIVTIEAAPTANNHAARKIDVENLRSDMMGEIDGTSTSLIGNFDSLETRVNTEIAAKQTKNVLSATAPDHVEGLIWIDTTDMSAYVSYAGAWIEMDRI